MSEFILPTEPGAEFWADFDGETFFFRTVESAAGWLYLTPESDYASTAHEVMTGFVDHRTQP